MPGVVGFCIGFRGLFSNASAFASSGPDRPRGSCFDGCGESFLRRFRSRLEFGPDLRGLFCVRVLGVLGLQRCPPILGRIPRE
jgi:hypothetical protein